MLSTILALPLPIGLFVLLLWRTAQQWRGIAKCYGAPGIKPHVEKQGWLVLSGGPALFNTYNGIVVAGVSGDKLTLRIVWPFALFHEPLAIPFNDISVERTRWYINDRSFKLRASHVPEIGMTMPEEFVRWIEDHSGRRLLPRAGAVQAAAA